MFHYFGFCRRRAFKKKMRVVIDREKEYETDFKVVESLDKNNRK